MTDFVKRKSSKPDQVEGLIKFYQERWRIENLKKFLNVSR